MKSVINDAENGSKLFVVLEYDVENKNIGESEKQKIKQVEENIKKINIKYTRLLDLVLYIRSMYGNLGEKELVISVEHDEKAYYVKYVDMHLIRFKIKEKIGEVTYSFSYNEHEGSQNIYSDEQTVFDITNLHADKMSESCRCKRVAIELQKYFMNIFEDLMSL